MLEDVDTSRWPGVKGRVRATAESSSCQPGPGYLTPTLSWGEGHSPHKPGQSQPRKRLQVVGSLRHLSLPSHL